ncbi:glucosamine-6-phosphate deaminase [Bacillus canaveralius]|uniref:Glucosamine-6-phosphate deaminase n=1 Tax=Bacillus canaveralius TaxID=1403243 RepID=A0A2N5GQJ9_9BACI|nr:MULTISPECIES: glucosamine-6-phosphate deaminase [Bacillus]PLR85344.1 glucosamine-6-phosphate deaminase [Bacillus canaveralius]PLR87884.1 glucosamine-6-phosphate deaminase [Bacillus sp. V33-4]PLR99336.1 glucosamine-6-phosphate deaminase [Bacillus canaveralius]RSK48588.1 glucosamine-6-phosphate deaminase [Bacillus canaveralius]
MKIVRASNYEEMSMKAAKGIIEKVRSKPDITLGLATGSTPKGVYRCIIEDHKHCGTSYQQAASVNLDEYIGLDQKDRNSYHSFMCREFFDHIDLPLERAFIPNGTATDLLTECARYEKTIQALGGIDLQILGIGHNGHIGFNEPGTPFTSRTHVVSLAESTRQANSRFFTSVDEVPTSAITMGIATILDSAEIYLLASGSSKADAIARLIGGDADEQFPASALKLHKNVTIFADEDALNLI